MLLGLCGCAPAVPALSGGGATPEARLDVAVGGAARVPLGELASEATSLIATDAPGGLAPVALGRFGLGGGWDLGVTVSGALARADVRAAIALDEDSDLEPVVIAAIGPYAGLVRDGEASGARYGVELPLLLGLDASSLIELWIGPRASLERVSGDVAVAGGNVEGGATVLRVGGVLGMAVGFRHVHALVELGAAWERWDGEVDGTATDVEGVALTPAFALRYRI